MRAFPLFPTALALLMGALEPGCAGSARRHKTAEQLSPDDARVFEQGIDFIAKLEGLEGRWREDWERDLQLRVEASDLVAVVTVRTLRTDTDPEQRITHHIVAHVDRAIAGETSADEIELSVRQGAAGFATIDDSLANLAQTQFIAYVKWLRAEDGRKVPFFHLSPASDEVLAETEGYIAMKK